MARRDGFAIVEETHALRGEPLHGASPTLAYDELPHWRVSVRDSAIGRGVEQATLADGLFEVREGLRLKFLPLTGTNRDRGYWNVFCHDWSPTHLCGDMFDSPHDRLFDFGLGDRNF